jgi:hypothetical protein
MLDLMTHLGKLPVKWTCLLTGLKTWRGFVAAGMWRRCLTKIANAIAPYDCWVAFANLPLQLSVRAARQKTTCSNGEIIRVVRDRVSYRRDLVAKLGDAI